jgi:hypothetical protein
MLKPDVPPEQLDLARPIVEPLLARLRSQADSLPPQADSALVFTLVTQRRPVPEAER